MRNTTGIFWGNWLKHPSKETSRSELKDEDQYFRWIISNVRAAKGVGDKIHTLCLVQARDKQSGPAHV
jgi:hypothetical protein